jgi:hypothetical protein
VDFVKVHDYLGKEARIKNSIIGLNKMECLLDVFDQIKREKLVISKTDKRGAPIIVEVIDVVSGEAIEFADLKYILTNGYKLPEGYELHIEIKGSTPNLENPDIVYNSRLHSLMMPLILANERLSVEDNNYILDKDCKNHQNFAIVGYAFKYNSNIPSVYYMNYSFDLCALGSTDMYFWESVIKSNDLHFKWSQGHLKLGKKFRRVLENLANKMVIFSTKIMIL